MDQNYLRMQVTLITGQSAPAIRLERLKGDASERNFYRLRLKGQQSLVLMEFDPPHPKRQDTLELVWKYFYSQNLGVPKLYHHHRERGLVFLEDCGDLTLERLVHEQPADVYYPYYEQAIELLLRIQQAGIQHGDPDCPAFGLAFDTEKLTQELEFFLKYMLEEHCQIKLFPSERVRLQGHFLALSHQLAAEPHYLTHRDYHSRNLMIKDGQIRLVDFQDARLGLCQYDLASLLRDSYVQLAEQQMDGLLEHYIQGKQEWEGAPIDRQRFRQTFDYTCIQRNLKAVGTFAYLACQRGKPGYLRFIPPTLEYVRQTFSRYPELTDFQELLGKYLPEVSRT